MPPSFLLIFPVDSEIEELFSTKKTDLDTMNVLKKVEDRDPMEEALKYYREALDLFGKVLYGKWDVRYTFFP
jgi:hypothetical protein